MNRETLIQRIRSKRSVLCLGLDPSIDKIPLHLKSSRSLSSTIIKFCTEVVTACEPHIVAVKPNFAFFEALGPDGLVILHEVIQQIHPDLFIIGDGKRGDIGNTASAYAKGGFEGLGCHALTVNPYMGEDSIRPFLMFKDRWAVVLGLTSNPGASDIQLLDVGGKSLFWHVMSKVATFGSIENLMFVVGATRLSLLKEIRSEFPSHFFLVPGVGAQGGNLEEVLQAGLNHEAGLLINASRSILYAGEGEDFADKARNAAFELHNTMRIFLS